MPTAHVFCLGEPTLHSCVSLSANDGLVLSVCNVRLQCQVQWDMQSDHYVRWVWDSTTDQPCLDLFICMALSWTWHRIYDFRGGELGVEVCFFEANGFQRWRILERKPGMYPWGGWAWRGNGDDSDHKDAQPLVASAIFMDNCEKGLSIRLVFNSLCIHNSLDGLSDICNF